MRTGKDGKERRDDEKGKGRKRIIIGREEEGQRKKGG